MRAGTTGGSSRKADANGAGAPAHPPEDFERILSQLIDEVERFESLVRTEQQAALSMGADKRASGSELRRVSTASARITAKARAALRKLRRASRGEVRAGGGRLAT